MLILVVLGGFVGLGSAIFHSHPNRVTLQIDLIPKMIFGLSYILFSMRIFFNHTYKISLLFTFSFMLFTMAFEMAVKNFKIPGINHLPSILALIIIGSLLFKNHLYRKVGKAFIIASGFYIVALFFRYFDFYIYRSFPLGTHFLWHAFTSCVVGILLYTAATYRNIQHHAKTET